MSFKFLQLSKRKTVITAMVLCVVVLGLFVPRTSFAIPNNQNSITIGGKTFTSFSGKLWNGNDATLWKGEDGTVYQDSNSGNNTGGLMPLDAKGVPTTDPTKMVGYTITDGVTSKGVVTEITQKDLNVTPPPANNPYTVIGNIFGWLLYMVSAAAGMLVSALITVMLRVMSYPISIHMEAVTQGWQAVRDLCNNFFIVILIAIAIGTIIKVPQWQIGQMLPKLLIMAILINFSKMFCGLMIDVSQILMLSFAAPLTGIKGNNIILAAIGIPDMYKLLAGTTNSADTASSYLQQGASTLSAQSGIGYGSIITALIYAMIATIIAAVVIGAIIAVLIARIVALLFLTVLSPLPFLLSTFKQGESYAGQWWKHMTSELIVGPVMLFFLWLSFMIMGYGGSTQTDASKNYTDSKNAIQVTANKGNTPKDTPSLYGADGKPLTDPTSDQQTYASSSGLAMISKAMETEGIINFALVIGMLILSLYMGKQTGAAGAGFAGSALSYLDKARKGATNMPWRAGKTGWKGAKAVGGGVWTAGKYAGRMVDDKYELRRKAATAIYGKGISKIPYVGKLLAKYANKKESDTQKREDEDMTNAYKVNNFQTLGFGTVANGGMTDDGKKGVLWYAKNGTSAEKKAAMERINDVDYHDTAIDDIEKKAMTEFLKDMRGNMTKNGISKGFMDNFDEKMAKKNQIMALRVMGPKDFGKRAAKGEINLREMFKKLRGDDVPLFFEAMGIKEPTQNDKGKWIGESVASQMAYKLGADIYDGDYKRAQEDIESIQEEHVRDALLNDRGGTFMKDMKRRATKDKVDRKTGKKVQARDANGDPLLDKEGKAVYEQVVDDKVRTGFLRTAISNEMDIGDVAGAYQEADGSITAEGKADLKTFMDTYGKQWAKNIKDAEKRCRDVINNEAKSDLEREAAKKEYKGISANISNIMGSLEFDGSPALYDELRGKSDADKDFMRDTASENLAGQFSGYIAKNTRGYTSQGQIDEALDKGEIETPKEAEEAKKEMEATKKLLFNARGTIEKVSQGGVKFAPDLIRKSIEANMTVAEKEVQKGAIDRFIDSLEDMVMGQKMSDLAKVKLDGKNKPETNMALAGKLVEKKKSTEIIQILTNPQQFERIGGALTEYLGQYIGKEEDKDTPEQVKALLALEEVYKRVTRNVKKGATTPKAPAQIQAGEDIAGMVAQAVNKEKEKK